MKRKSFLYFTIIIIFALTPAKVFAFNEIDRIELQCINNTNKYNEMMICTQNARKAWENEIKVYSDFLKRDLSGSDLKIFLSSERKWENYKDTEFALIDKLLKQKTNLMNKNIACGLKKDIVKNRAVYLKDYYSILNEK